MPLRINTNVASIAAQRNLNSSNEREQRSLRALSSGNRIVRPGDDAAGLAISENLRGQVAGIRQARSNSENAVSLIQTAEGGLNEQNNILIRLRELGIQSASDTVTDVEREFLNMEFSQLREEFDRISSTTQFGTKKLLDGSGGQLEFHVGPNSSEENIVSFTLDADSTAGTLGVEGLSVDDQDEARDSLVDIDEALTSIQRMRADFGAIQSRLHATTSNLDVQLENLSEAKSRISDTDVAFETAEVLGARVTQEAGIAVLAQANELPLRAIRLINSL
jgi:flagellin